MFGTGINISKNNIACMLAHTDRLRFTFNGSGMAVYPPGATFGPRTLHDYEFVWIIAGNVEWIVDGKLIHAPPGTVLLARPGQIDSFRWDPRARTQHGYFHFYLHQHGAKLPVLSQWPLARTVNDQDILRPLFHHLGWLLERDEAQAREQAQGVMRQAFVAFMSGLLGTTVAQEELGHPLVEMALTYVQERWQEGDLEAITLGDLARVTQVSKVHLTRLFQASLGVSPMTALRHLRLDRAVSLLSRTNWSIQHIAEATGFPNPFHFSKVFSAVYGRSPRAFRQGVAKGEVPALNKLLRTRGLADRRWR